MHIIQNIRLFVNTNWYGLLRTYLREQLPIESSMGYPITKTMIANAMKFGVVFSECSRIFMSIWRSNRLSTSLHTSTKFYQTCMWVLDFDRVREPIYLLYETKRNSMFLRHHLKGNVLVESYHNFHHYSLNFFKHKFSSHNSSSFYVHKLLFVITLSKI